MAMNRVQFQAGLSMVEFFERYGTEAKCRRALERTRWPEGFVCPRCAGTQASRFVRGELPYWQCAGCRHQTSLLAGTVFESTKLPLVRWFLAMQLLTQAKNNVSALELKRQLGVSYASAWLVKHKLMQAMRVREARRTLTGRVEMDDAYLGGERPGKPGRGSPNKVPMVAAVQTDAAGRPVLACLSAQPFTSERIEAFARRHLSPGALVVSDGLRCFMSVKAAGAAHERHLLRPKRHGEAACARLPQFAAVNTLLGNLKTGIAGTYHAFDFAKYAHRYLAEFQYRFNRRYDMARMLPRLLNALVTAPASPERILRLAEAGR